MQGKNNAQIKIQQYKKTGGEGEGSLNFPDEEVMYEASTVPGRLKEPECPVLLCHTPLPLWSMPDEGLGLHFHACENTYI